MLNCHAYARAIRAHPLLQLFLTIIIFKDLDTYDAIDENLMITAKNIIDNTISYNDVEHDNETSGALLNQFNEKLKQHKSEDLPQNYGFNLLIWCRLETSL